MTTWLRGSAAAASDACFVFGSLRSESRITGFVRTSSNCSTVCGRPVLEHLELRLLKVVDDTAVAARVDVDQHEVRAAAEDRRLLVLDERPGGSIATAADAVRQSSAVMRNRPH